MKKRTGMGAAAAALLLCAGAGSADVIFNLTTEFSGADQPLNVATAVFADAGADKVSLKMSLAGDLSVLGAQEHVKEWYFNLNPALQASIGSLNFSLTGKSRTDIATFAVGKDINNFKADGDGWFDILFSFSNGGSDERFKAGDWVEYEISGITGLTEDSFSFLSADKKGSTGVAGPNGLPSAAHIGGIYTGVPDPISGSLYGGSGWVTVPLPTSAWIGLAGLGLAAGVSVIKRRR